MNIVIKETLGILNSIKITRHDKKTFETLISKKVKIFNRFFFIFSLKPIFSSCIYLEIKIRYTLTFISPSYCYQTSNEFVYQIIYQILTLSYVFVNFRDPFFSRVLGSKYLTYRVFGGFFFFDMGGWSKNKEKRGRGMIIT